MPQQHKEIEGRPLLENEEYSSEDDVSQSDLQHAYGNAYTSVNSDQEEHISVDSLRRPEIKVYKRRWYILLVFSLFSMTFSAVWNCFGPISSAVEVAFNWDDSTIAMLTNLGPIGYMVTGFVFPWLMQEKGLRFTILLSLLLSGTGNTLRSLSSDPDIATPLMYIGQAMNGFIGPMAMAAIPQVSSVWFPPHERVTATSISNSFCIFGYGVAFLLGPWIVSDVNSTMHNGTSTAMLQENLSLNSSLTTTVSSASMVNTVSGMEYDPDVVHRARTEILRYMYIEAGWSWILFLTVLIYFPAQPPLPPGLSAVAARESYWGGLWSLKGKLGFLLVAFSYGISTGVTAGWAALLSVTLKKFGVEQDESGWIGFYAISGSCILALLVCRFADRFVRHIKVFIVVMYSLGTVALVIFALITEHVITFNKGLVYFAVIAGFTLTNGAIPLLFELACELAYPTSESAANGLLTFLNNFFCLLFLMFLSLPDIGTEWEHWTVVASCFICVPLIGMLKSRFNRLDLDEATPILDPQQQQQQASDISNVGDRNYSHRGINNDNNDNNDDGEGDNFNNGNNASNNNGNAAGNNSSGSGGVNSVNNKNGL